MSCSLDHKLYAADLLQRAQNGEQLSLDQQRDVAKCAREATVFREQIGEKICLITAERLTQCLQNSNSSEAANCIQQNALPERTAPVMPASEKTTGLLKTIFNPQAIWSTKKGI
ncbi:MAG: hypothetical protein COT84_08535 [Chlamydiae bacterium CG10_big_fil_rev_8_21_14_0_10_35_9]|nr:MAG: hypothetical protein COT84_08535 [Chlamydiae bacterium CG10_big_fil_rev_8_21_14_0_10_35_9]